MNSSPPNLIPHRAQTLEVLRLMGKNRPILMLLGDEDGYGTRWLLDGQEILPGIAKYLIQKGFIVESGATEFGVRKLVLTDSGDRLRQDGVRWWMGLGFFERLRVRILG